MIDERVKVNDGYLLLDKSNIMGNRGKALYLRFNDNDKLIGYEVHKLRYKQNGKFRNEFWQNPSKEQFGKLGWYFMHSEKERAYDKYERLVFREKICSH